MTKIAPFLLWIAAAACSRENATEPAAYVAMKGAPSPSQAAAPVQKLIRTGELTLRVDDVRQGIQRADSIVAARGGRLADSRFARDEHASHEARLLFRIPADRFLETVAALRALGKVEDETVSAQDITKEYADLETRLAVKEETVRRLRALLEARTAKLSDVLEVERELGRAVTELEQMKGERRYYDQQVALSSLTLVLSNASTARISAFFDPVRDALRGALKVLGTSFAGVIYVVTFLLPWLAVALPVWWVVTRSPLSRALSRRPAVPASTSSSPAGR